MTKSNKIEKIIFCVTCPLICPYVLATIDAKAFSLAADSCRFTISGAFALVWRTNPGK